MHAHTFTSPINSVHTNINPIAVSKYRLMCVSCVWCVCVKKKILNVLKSCAFFVCVIYDNPALCVINASLVNLRQPKILQKIARVFFFSFFS